jgi:hypothetical protein
MRLVLIIVTYLLFIPAGNTADFSIYKSTCSDIGFTPDTDPFADCVLELYKRDKIKLVIKENKQQRNVVINSEKKSQSGLEDLKTKQRKEQYQRELRFTESQRERHALKNKRDAERLTKERLNYQAQLAKSERERLAREQQQAKQAKNKTNNAALFLGILAGIAVLENLENGTNSNYYVPPGLTGGPNFDWDIFSNGQYRCRTINGANTPYENGQWAKNNNCSGMPVDDDRWPG